MDGKEPVDKIVIKFEIESQRWIPPHATWFNETRETLVIIDGKEPFMDEVNRLERFRSAVLQVIDSAIENWSDPEGVEPAYEPVA